MMRVAVINGPNLNLLGKRQPEIYGTMTLAELEDAVGHWAETMGIEIAFFQSNDESELVGHVQASGGLDGVLLNAGGFTHTSVAIADAVASVEAPVVEVHLSDVDSREPFRRVSLIAPNAVYRISGRGPTGYRDALRYLVNRSHMPSTTIRYGPHPRNLADLRGSRDSGLVIVLVHGGYWYSGWDRDQLDSIAIDLAERGFATMNIGYRLSPPWPGSGHDVASALAHARATAEKVAVVGHSAGGYLSLWAHRRHPVDLCVGLAAVTDLSLADDVPAGEQIVAAGGPEKLEIPSDVVLFHGLDDTEVSPSHSARGQANSTVHMLEGVGHFDLVNPNRPHWEQVASTLSVGLGA